MQSGEESSSSGRFNPVGCLPDNSWKLHSPKSLFDWDSCCISVAILDVLCIKRLFNGIGLKV